MFFIEFVCPQHYSITSFVVVKQIRARSGLHFFQVSLLMTSIPTSFFIYDKKGNLVNVLPTARSTSDVVIHQSMGETSPAVYQTIPPFIPQLKATPHTFVSLDGLPMVTKEAVFGYNNRVDTYEIQDTHKITSARPLITAKKQPESVDTRVPIPFTVRTNDPTNVIDVSQSSVSSYIESPETVDLLPRSALVRFMANRSAARRF